MSIQYKSIKNLTSMLQNKEISHKELINETFTLIESKMDLNAFITLNKDAAIEKATLLDSKKEWFIVSRNTNCSEGSILY
jgi:Asp-tRNA(Asn)/Glu-tRNA(Gln) amidotransferase A subunit family amidase